MNSYFRIVSSILLITGMFAEVKGACTQLEKKIGKLILLLK